MSAALARLRILLGDQLLVRGPGGLVYTPRAESLIGQIDQIIALLGNVTSLPEAFEPHSSRRVFKLAGTDFVEFFLLPPLMGNLAREAPSIEIEFNELDQRTMESAMAAGELDLAIGYLPKASDGLTRSVLFKEPFVCIARRGHPALQDGPLSVDRFVEVQHVQALMRDGTMYADAIDSALAAQGLVRKISLWQLSFLAVTYVVSHTDLIATIPRLLATGAATRLPIEIHKMPLQLPPAEFATYWHPRSRDDRGHKWLREMIGSLLRH